VFKQNSLSLPRLAYAEIEEKSSAQRQEPAASEKGIRFRRFRTL